MSSSICEKCKCKEFNYLCYECHTTRQIKQDKTPRDIELIDEVYEIIKKHSEAPISEPIKIITTHLDECPECGAPRMMIAHVEGCSRCMSCGFTLCK